MERADHAERPGQALADAPDRVAPRAVPTGGHGGVWAPERRALTAGLVTTITLVAFEALAIATVMPLVAEDLDGLALYGWAFSAFFLGNLVGIVAAGVQIDRFGLVRPFAVGLALFGVGLLVGGAAPSMAVLALGRAIQGFGAGAVGPVGYVAIGRAYPEALQPRVFAIMSTAWVVPGLVGPAIAGLIAEHLHWRWVFLGLVPPIVVAGALAVSALRRAGEATQRVPATAVGREEAPGSATAGRAGGDGRRLADACLVAIGAGLLLAANPGLAPLVVVALLLAGVVLGLPALRRLLPPGTLAARRGMPTTVLSRGVLTFAFFGAEAYLPLALVSIRGTSAAEAGLALTSATLTWTAGSWIQARLLPRRGHRALIRAGFALVLAGVAASTSLLLPGVPVLAAVVTWGVAGLGMGLAYSPLSLLVLREAPSGGEGAATSGLQLSDVLGTALGTGAGGAIVGAGAALAVDASVPLFAAFAGAAAVAAGGLVLTRRLHGPAELPPSR